MVRVTCGECGIKFRLPADDEQLIAWEGIFCSDDCRHSSFGESEDFDDDYEDEPYKGQLYV